VGPAGDPDRERSREAPERTRTPVVSPNKINILCSSNQPIATVSCGTSQARYPGDDTDGHPDRPPSRIRGAATFSV